MGQCDVQLYRAWPLPPASIGFGENPIAALRPDVILSQAKDLNLFRLDEMAQILKTMYFGILRPAAAGLRMACVDWRRLQDDTEGRPQRQSGPAEAIWKI